MGDGEGNAIDVKYKNSSRTATYTYYRYIEFDANGGEGTAPDATHSHSGKDATTAINANTFTRGGYEFKGWYEKGVKISDVASFNYFMTGVDNVTLEARFEYNPTNPDDPFSEDNDPTFLYGDVDRDMIVDVTDAVILNGHYINGTTGELQFTIADVNRDGVIDISDVVEAIQIYLNTKLYGKKIT